MLGSLPVGALPLSGCRTTALPQCAARSGRERAALPRQESRYRHAPQHPCPRGSRHRAAVGAHRRPPAHAADPTAAMTSGSTWTRTPARSSGSPPTGDGRAPAINALRGQHAHGSGGSVPGAGPSARHGRVRRMRPTTRTNSPSWWRTTSLSVTPAAGTPRCRVRPPTRPGSPSSPAESPTARRASSSNRTPRGLRVPEPGPDPRTPGHARRSSPSSTVRHRTPVSSGRRHPGWVGARRRWPSASTRRASAKLPRLLLNISNHYTTAQNTAYGNAVNSELAARYGYTSRSSSTPAATASSNGEWCNAAGRRIGTPTRMGGGAEMLLWIKAPGESDGNCGVGTSGSTAGQIPPRGRSTR